MVVSNQVVPPVGGDHLIGIDDIGFIPSGMKLFVQPIAVVGEGHLLFVGNGFVQNFNGIKQLRIVGLCIR